MELPSGARQQRVEAISEPFAGLLPLSRFKCPDYRDQVSVKPLAKLGCIGFSLGVEDRGLGLSVTEEALLFERLGRQLATPSLAAGSLAARIAVDAGDKPMAKAILSGDWILSFATRAENSGNFILHDARDADLLLLADGDDLFLVQNSITHERRIIDMGAWGLIVEEAKIESPPIHRASGGERDRMALLCAAQLVGIAQAARDYAGHCAPHLADMESQATTALDALTHATKAFANRAGEAGDQCRSALRVASRAAHINAGLNIEADGDKGSARLFVQRAQAWSAIAGGDSGPI